MYVCCWKTLLRHIDLNRLSLLSYVVMTNHVWPSSNKYIPRVITGVEQLETKIAVVPLSCSFPCKATSPQLHRAALLMLQESSAKWQMAVSQRGYYKF